MFPSQIFISFPYEAAHLSNASENFAAKSVTYLSEVIRSPALLYSLTYYPKVPSISIVILNEFFWSPLPVLCHYYSFLYMMNLIVLWSVSFNTLHSFRFTTTFNILFKTRSNMVLPLIIFSAFQNRKLFPSCAKDLSILFNMYLGCRAWNDSH